MKRRELLFLLGLSSVTGGLAIAGGHNRTTATIPTNTLLSQAGTTPASDNELVIYSGLNEKLVGKLIQQFSEKTGATVQVRYCNTAELAAAILEEGKNSPADVFFAQDAGALGALQQEGRTVQMPSAVLNQVDSRYRSPQGQWVGISGRVRTVDYNTKNVKPSELPKTIFGFTEPRWKGRIGWAPTNGSFQAFVTALRVSEGDKRARQWLEGIKANNPRVYPNNTAIIQGLAQGEIDVGFVNHYYLEQLKQENPKVPIAHHFTNDVGSLVNVAGVAILNTSDSPKIAQRFVEFLLSPEAQQYFATQTSEYPLTAKVKAKGNLRPLTEIRRQTPNIDLSNLSDLEATLELLQQTQEL